MNKQKGNMYGFITSTWNPIKGKCSHDCSYCYMKVYPQKPLHLVEKELKDDLGSGNFIFVGSSTDMFAEDVQKVDIERVLEHCRDYPKNRYLFQSKNPERMYSLFEFFPKNAVFGTTIESNRTYPIQKCPSPEARAWWIQQLNSVDVMVTIEPILDFDLDVMVKWIEGIHPKWINIGADSKGHKLPEPSKEKIIALIQELRKFTEVKLKDNLKRIIGNDFKIN